MRRGLPLGLTILLACVAATASFLGYGKLTGQLNPPGSLFATPIPYVVLFLSFFIASPIYMVLRPWVGLSAWRFAGIALLLGAVTFVFVAERQWGWHPAFVNVPTVLWICGGWLALAVPYWAVLRLLAPKLGE